MKINSNLTRASLMIVLFLLGLGLAHNITPAHGQSTTSTNMIINPGFESPLSNGWVGDIFDDGTYGDTITTNNTLSHTGAYSARLDISNNDTSIALNRTTTNSHIELIQYPTNPPPFNNFTDRPDGLDLWFYVQPKFSGYTVFEVRFRTSNVFELDYVYYNPDPVLGYQGGFANSTNGSEGGKPVKVIFLPTLKLNQWNHLVRNVRQDWLAPLKLPNGTFVNPGFSLNDKLDRFEVNANFYKDPSTGNVYAETAWVDDILLYTGGFQVPTLTFQDWNGITVNQSVNWKFYNSSTSPQIQLPPDDLLLSNTIVVKTYYSGYQIYTSTITPLTSTTIRLPMIAVDSSRSGFIAFNSTISSANVTENDQNKITFTSHGSGPALIVVKVPARPISVEKNGTSISTWTYNSTSGATAIRSSTLGTFTIVFNTPPNDQTLTILIVAIVVSLAILGSAILLWRRKTNSRLSRETSKPPISKNKPPPNKYRKKNK